MTTPVSSSAYLSICHTTRSCPRLPYERIKDDILGKTYALSLVFVGTRQAQALNRTHRKKRYAPNVLSFALEKTHGEIFITPQVAEKEARQREMTVRRYIGLLFIHALLHLKGKRHGDTMGMLEKIYCTKYNLK